jgi:TonB family protein
MKRALSVSIILHLAFIGALAVVGQTPPRSLARGYPQIMMATLIQKPPAFAGASAPPIQATIEEPRQEEVSAPELKPLPSTKLGAKPAAPKPPPEKKPTPSPRPASRAATGSATGPSTSRGSGGNSIKIDAPEFPYPHYLVLVKYRIEANWQPPFNALGREVTTIYFKIVNDGEVQDIKIESSSGNFSLDQAALRAVYSANPLPPLPSGSGLQHLGVHFEFAAN